MAPSATETVTETARGVSNLKLTSNPYKELAPVGYEKDAELKGKDGFQAAKVCAFRASRYGTKTSISTKTICQLGLPTLTQNLSHLCIETQVLMQIQLFLIF